MAAMTTPGPGTPDSTDPGERAVPSEGAGTAAPGEPGREARRLAEAPSSRYAAPDRPVRAPGAGSSLTGPLTRATIVALAGAVALVLVGAVLASTAGLLFVAGIAGAAIGLVLARAAAPRDETRRPTPRRTVAWLSIGLALAAVAVGAVATWLIARLEGGTLGIVDYLIEAFGLFVPAEAVLAAIAAWWGASAGPVQS